MSVERRGRPRLIHRGARRRGGAALACAAALFGIAEASHAYHEGDEHVVDDSAWTPRGDKRWRLSLVRLDYGLTDRLSVGTYTWPWLASTPNLNVKWQFYLGSFMQWAARASLFRLDTAAFDPDSDDAPVFTLAVFEVSNSWSLGRKHELSHNLAYAAVRVRGEVTSDTLSGFGELGVTNLQYVAAYELRLSKTLALLVKGRYVLAQVLDGATDVTLEPDAFTTIEIVGSGQDARTLHAGRLFSIAPSLVGSWNSFNVRAGVGYGNYNLPGINFTLESRGFFPEFDLYWKF